MENKLLDTIFSNYRDMHTHLFELSAIWIKIDSRLVRVKAGDKLNVTLGKVTSLKNPTHLVTKCRGTLNDSVLELTLQDLESNDTLILNV